MAISQPFSLSYLWSPSWEETETIYGRWKRSSKSQKFMVILYTNIYISVIKTFHFSLIQYPSIFSPFLFSFFTSKTTYIPSMRNFLLGAAKKGELDYRISVLELERTSCVKVPTKTTKRLPSFWISSLKDFISIGFSSQSDLVYIWSSLVPIIIEPSIPHGWISEQNPSFLNPINTSRWKTNEI